MLNKPRSIPARLQLEQLLGRARAKIRRAYVRRTLSLAVEKAAYVLVVTGLVAIGLRLVDTSKLASVVIAVAGVIAAASIIVVKYVQASLLRHDFYQVAERLDLAVGDANAIATALDFTRNGDTSGFALRAIDNGLAAARAWEATDPIIDSHRFKQMRVLGLVFGGVALFVLSQWMPLWQVKTTSIADSRQVAVPGDVPTRPATIKTLALPANASAPLATSPASSSSTAGALPGTKRLDSNPDASPSATAGNGASPAFKPSKMTASSAQQSPPVDHATPQLAAHTQLASANQDPSADTAEASPSSPSGDNNSDSTGSSTANKQHDPPSQATETRDKAGSGSDSSPTDNQSPVTKKAGAPSAQESSSGKENKPSKKGAGAGSNSSQNGMNGNGKQPGGGNAPKKSRGVAPLMLGTREPDLFEGKKLPGVVEHTELPVPPQPTPDSPAAATITAARDGDESVVSPYAVPAEMRQLVSDYFHQFHSDDEQK
jgi:hypothetical protein